jgi:hypothetical protein
MSESSPTYAPAGQPERAESNHELTIREHELRRLQGTIESLAGAESLVRRGMAGDQPRLCHLGLDTLRKALVDLTDVARQFRPADLRPDLSEAYLAQVVDDLAYVETVADQTACPDQARIGVAKARVNLNLALLSLRIERGGVA